MREVVFLPNHAIPESHVKNFRADCCKGSTPDWTCKKTAKKDDLYLFWFGKPIEQIIGAGVIDGNFNEKKNDGADYTNAPKLWECSFKPLVEFQSPITKQRVKSNPTLMKWWKTIPYRGRPKAIPPQIASLLISLIQQLDPPMAAFLGNYGPIAPNPIQDITIPDDDANPPAKIRCEVTRIVRCTEKGRKLKNLYRFKCQICRCRIIVPNSAASGYMEVHHMRPLGGVYKGHDNWNNMLVLCPNCHVEFDRLAVAIDPKTGRVLCYDRNNEKVGRKIQYLPGHSLAEENIAHHYKRFQEMFGAKNG